MKYSLKIALSSVLGATALIVSLSFHGIPYPIAPFLKIDFSEIIDLLALFIGGWWVGLAVTTIHFLGLMVNAEYVIGPPMKYIAVLSMYLGIYIIMKLFRWEGREFGVDKFIVITLSSSIVRALVMILVNILVLLYIAPEFYIFFEKQLSMLTGVNPSAFDVFMYIVLIIGSYNIIQTVFALIPVYILYNIIKKHVIIRGASLEE